MPLSVTESVRSIKFDVLSERRELPGEFTIGVHGDLKCIPVCKVDCGVRVV